jgi:hypothetical protein
LLIAQRIGITENPICNHYINNVPYGAAKILLGTILFILNSGFLLMHMYYMNQSSPLQANRGMQ